ncbi:nuclear protein export protein [Stagonosporopsis vannaccii]|nr:nuclear protein export protein [Stagonosporopsis vannaccii]
MSSSEQQESAPKAAETPVSPARSDKSSDSEGRPVREKLQKTSIDATANPISVLGQTTNSTANGTLQPGSRSASGSDSERGRLRRKRSREDVDDDNEGDKQPDKKQERLEKVSEKPERHARKRSRDITKDLEDGALGKPVTTSVSTIEETDAEMASQRKHAAKSADMVARTGTSPKNKRPREEIEGSEVVADVAQDAPINGQIATKAGDERESKRARDKEEAKPTTSIPAGSGFANTSAASPFAAMAAKPPAPKTSDKTEALPQTSDDKFKASGFGSLANSSASPFGSFGAAAKGGSPFGGAPKLSSFASPAAAPSTAAPSASGFGSLGGAKSSFGGGSVFGGASNSPFGASFASKPSGTSSFATPGAGGITGLSSKPERAFGAPGDKDEEEGSDQEDDGDDNPEKDHEEGRRPSQPLSGTAPTETGEEHEYSAWVGRAKLYTMDGEGKERGWKERGVGNIKLNVTKDEPRKARFVLRADGTHRLLLNAAVTKTLIFGADSEGAKPKDGRLLFNSPNAEGNLDMHLLKLKSERAVELWEQVAQVQKHEL